MGLAVLGGLVLLPAPAGAAAIPVASQLDASYAGATDFDVTVTAARAVCAGKRIFAVYKNDGTNHFPTAIGSARTGPANGTTSTGQLTLSYDPGGGEYLAALHAKRVTKGDRVYRCSEAFHLFN